MFYQAAQKTLITAHLPTAELDLQFWTLVQDSLEKARGEDRLVAYEFSFVSQLVNRSHAEHHKLLSAIIAQQFDKAGREGVSLPKYPLVTPFPDAVQALVDEQAKKYKWENGILFATLNTWGSRPDLSMFRGDGVLGEHGFSNRYRGPALTPIMQIEGEDEANALLVPLDIVQFNDTAKAAVIDCIATACLSQQVRKSTTYAHTRGFKFVVEYDVASKDYYRPEADLLQFIQHVKWFIANKAGGVIDNRIVP